MTQHDEANTATGKYDLDQSAEAPCQEGETFASHTPEILAFRLGGNVFGLPVSCVVQIIEMLAITPLPHLPASLRGIFNFHGQVVPVMDLRSRFGLAIRPYGLHTPIILAEWEDQILGLVVDEVEAIFEDVAIDDWKDGGSLVAQLLNNHSRMLQQPVFSHLVKVGDQFIPLLQLGALLNHDEQDQLAAVIDQRTLSGALA